jgi:CRISPR-associated protein Cas2
MGGQFVLISYDIANDKRRLKIMKTLQDFGRRVQYSVFECRLTGRQVRALRRRLAPLVRERSDSIRFYFLSADDVERVLVLGAGSVTQDPPFYFQ